MRQTRTFSRGLAVPGAGGGEISRTRRVVAVGAATALAMAIVAFWIVASLPPALPSIAAGQTDIAPQTALTISVSNLGGSVQALNMTQAFYDIDGNLGPDTAVPVHLVPAGASAASPWRTDYRIERADGAPLLGYDGRYDLDIVATSVAASLIGRGTTSEHLQFTSLPSPRLRVPAAPLQLTYQSPAQLTWNRPIENLQVEAVPAVDVKARIDPNNPELSYVDLVGAKPDTQYQLRVVDATAVGGGKLISPTAVTVITPAPPVALTDKATIEDGYRITIPWDRPIQSFDYEITPAVASVPNIGGADAKQSSILLQNAKQGQQYTVRIKGAVATTGYPESQPKEFKVATPNPLKIDKFDPEQPKYGVPRGVGINIGFSEPVKDRKLTEQAIKIAPAVPGKFVWKSDTLVQFAPTGDLPAATDFTVTVAGGREGAIGKDGAYLDKSEQFAFWTAPEKLIEVDLSRQYLTLWEGGTAVWGSLVSTGVRGAETPTGRYTVQYKMESTRMRGVNPSGHAYDLPNVPWVLPFLGDYTIHGAYWRDTYGVEQSNGCVSMPVPAALHVYEWADVGTPVRIHY
ncbi:MAG TPA: L,D-transpeptidase [Chloroflexota bacterium]